MRPLAAVRSIHFLAERKKLFLPASFAISSSSRELNSGLSMLSRTPRLSFYMVYLTADLLSGSLQLRLNLLNRRQAALELGGQGFGDALLPVGDGDDLGSRPLRAYSTTSLSLPRQSRRPMVG